MRARVGALGIFFFFLLLLLSGFAWVCVTGWSRRVRVRDYGVLRSFQRGMLGSRARAGGGGGWWGGGIWVSGIWGGGYRVLNYYYYYYYFPPFLSRFQEVQALGGVGICDIF